jgi:TonB family protein
VRYTPRTGLPPLIAICAFVALTRWPASAGQESSASTSDVVDIRGIWKDTKLDKKGAAARGLDASDIQTPRKVKNVPPTYPEGPKRQRIQGTVNLECTIGTDGIPTDCSVTRGPDPRLNDEALRCVRKWRFKPLTVRGQPARALVEFTVNFRLSWS